MTQFIVHGTHITENLEHHKMADVRRILEDKGFEEAAGSNADEAVHFHPPAGAPEADRETRISFGDDGFVSDSGVRHSGA